MKILIITPRYHLNLYYRVKALLDAGHEVKMISQHKGISENYDILEPVVVGFSPVYAFFDKLRIKLFGDTISYFWKLNIAVPHGGRLKKEVKDFNPDVIIVKGMQNVFTLRSLLITRKKAFMLIQARKHFGDTWKKKIFLYILKNILKVRGIISPLKNILKEADSYFNYIPFVIETKEFEKEHFKDDYVNIIDIGKYQYRKDHIVLLKAINRIKDKYKIRLTIIGEKDYNDGSFDEALKYIKENNLSDIVEMKMNIPYKEVLGLYKEFDLYVLPSYREQAAVSIIEAMANKLPVICSDTCGTRCYLEEGENGLVFKSRDYKDLAEKIETIIKDRDKLKKMGEKSFQLVKKNHSLKLFNSEVESLVSKYL